MSPGQGDGNKLGRGLQQQQSTLRKLCVCRSGRGGCIWQWEGMGGSSNKLYLHRDCHGSE